MFLAFCCKAQVLITDQTKRLKIGAQLELLQTEEDLKIEEVMRSTNFKKSGSHVPNLGVNSNKQYNWARFSVTNKSSNPVVFLDLAYPLIDRIDLYAVTSSGIEQRVTGQLQPFELRAIKHPNYIFDLRIPKDSTVTYYLQAVSAEPIFLPISIGRQRHLWEQLNTETLIVGIFVGISLVMIAYNLFLFFSIRDTSYLWYITYVLFLCLTHVGIKGYSYQYLWPGNPEFEQKSVIFFACLSSIGGLMFANTFLRTRDYSKKMFMVSLFLAGLFALSFVLTALGKLAAGFQLMHLATIFFTLMILPMSYISVKRGYRPARYFFAGWSVFTIGMAIFILKDLGILPYNLFTSYSVIAASAVEVSLLAFALADRIKLLKAEKEKYQEELVQVAQQNERMVREHNILLEQEVKNRTSQLNEANSELMLTLNNLEIAQNQLLQSEKMASLGFLSRGIAHEINNPINFVAANVSPLRRDVDELFHLIEMMEELINSKASVPEKKKLLREYNEKIDFDYLKTEVNYLFNGIAEGSGRTLKILDGLRIFSKVHENDLKYVDINRGLDSTLLIINHLLTKIRLEKKYADLPALKCYPGKLNQIFLNILLNSIHAIQLKFGDEQGGAIEIATGVRDNALFVSIKDNGIGMEEAVKERVFEPFFTTKEFGGGAGLGMSISYNTVKNHNGDIEVQSTVGEGSQFTVWLPVEQN
ncbi:7TM diverse intracellular signaling domain-containing protein [Pedobacter sp. SYSU D00535]|uniref:sensor histidine kinase n=1 Tax=Pedobacter sp. SYSU D00535 TaxID=2810308 RepID=UPI001A957ADF|nr:7TM diverse intracellular signaling domain-containing protein [Pedobacter sp. SYSU D00535]